MLRRIRELYNNKSRIDFVQSQRTSFTFSAILVLMSLFFIAFNGINFGIDFTGGLFLEASSDKEIDVINIREKLESENITGFVVQHLGSNNEIAIKIKATNNCDINTVKNIFKDYNFVYNKGEFAGAVFSKDAVINGIVAVMLAFAGVFMYLWVRFDWKFGIAGIIGLLHNFIICWGVFAVSNLEFNISSVAALLTVVGYSINDSVVIFDRIREKILKIKDLSRLINVSINSTLFRNILTSFTTLTAIFSIIVFCRGEIQSFAIVVFVGILVGTYSSIYLSSLLLNVMMKQTRPVQADSKL